MSRTGFSCSATWTASSPCRPGGRIPSASRRCTHPPGSDDDVVELLDRLETVREEFRQTDIEALEADMDRAVYDLFDLTEDEREVVEDYLDLF